MSTAFGAALRSRLGVSAVMAHKPPVGTVIGQSGAAAGTFRCLTAVYTNQCTAVAATVKKQNRLSALISSLPQGILKRQTQTQSVSVLQFLLHVHQLYSGQCLAIIAVFQSIQAVPALFGMVHGLDGGRSRAQHHQGLFFHTAPHCHLTGIVAWGLFGFIRMLLLLIKNDQTGSAAGGEYR